MTDSVMDKGKTMAPRAHSTLNHPEVNQRRATQFFPLLASTKLASHTFYSLAYLARISYLLRLPYPLVVTVESLFVQE